MLRDPVDSLGSKVRGNLLGVMASNLGVGVGDDRRATDCSTSACPPGCCRCRRCRGVTERGEVEASSSYDDGLGWAGGASRAGLVLTTDEQGSARIASSSVWTVDAAADTCDDVTFRESASG